MIILFPQKKDIARLLNSNFYGSALLKKIPIPQDIQEIISIKNCKLSKEDEIILSEILNTVLLLKPIIKEQIRKITYPELSDFFNYYHEDFTNWYDRGHFIRICLSMLDKKLSPEALSFIAFIEIFHIALIAVDEACDRTQKCEDSYTWWKHLRKRYSSELYNNDCDAQIATIFLNQLLHKMFYDNISIIGNKNMSFNSFENIVKDFAYMYDEVYYGFYRDIFFIDLNDFLETDIDTVESIVEYFKKIKSLWGTQFEIGIKIITTLLRDVSQVNITQLAKIGNLWGQALKIRDDIVDLIGDKEGLGREPVEDIIIDNKKIKFKKTLPLLITLTKLKKDKLSVDEIREIIIEIKDKNLEIWNNKKLSFAIQDSKIQLCRVVEGILSLLKIFPDNEGKQSLIRLAKRITLV